MIGKLVARQSERDAQLDRRKSVSSRWRRPQSLPIVLRHRVPSASHPNRDPSARLRLDRNASTRRRHRRRRTAPIDVQQEFQKAVDPVPPAALSRAEQIKRDMATWRRRTNGKYPGERCDPWCPRHKNLNSLALPALTQAPPMTNRRLGPGNDS